MKGKETQILKGNERDPYCKESKRTADHLLLDMSTSIDFGFDFALEKERLVLSHNSITQPQKGKRDKCTESSFVSILSKCTWD